MTSGSVITRQATYSSIVVLFSIIFSLSMTPPKTDPCLFLLRSLSQKPSAWKWAHIFGVLSPKCVNALLAFALLSSYSPSWAPSSKHPYLELLFFLIFASRSSAPIVVAQPKCLLFFLLPPFLSPPFRPPLFYRQLFSSWPPWISTRASTQRLLPFPELTSSLRNSSRSSAPQPPPKDEPSYSPRFPKSLPSFQGGYIAQHHGGISGISHTERRNPPRRFGPLLTPPPLKLCVNVFPTPHPSPWASRS